MSGKTTIGEYLEDVPQENGRVSFKERLIKAKIADMSPHLFTKLSKLDLSKIPGVDEQMVIYAQLLQEKIKKEIENDLQESLKQDELKKAFSPPQSDMRKEQEMREFAVFAKEKGIRPMEYYFCEYEKDEFYLIPYPAQHPILETPIFRVEKTAKL
ncbi:MAG: hypothetical protein US15_C0073G0005 [Candidatus Moranbacteria bacterium GW2011_GWF1_36_4]|nr:MAG: hypothetical protein US15_C0073G0005 [Candidatus Moranbacteria bacterium GW2011_GWF1_36_4]